jgi:hypothetical protein
MIRFPSHSTRGFEKFKIWRGEKKKAGRVRVCFCCRGTLSARRKHDAYPMLSVVLIPPFDAVSQVEGYDGKHQADCSHDDSAKPCRIVEEHFTKRHNCSDDDERGQNGARTKTNEERPSSHGKSDIHAGYLATLAFFVV